VASRTVCRAFGGTATSGSMVYEPCQSGGMAAVYVSAADRKIDIRWRGPSDGNGSPVLGGGAAWVTAYAPHGGASGTLYELSSATGAIRSQIEIGAGLPHFSSLSLAGGTAYVSTLTGITAVNGA
jgi:hypothetical protein